MKMRFLFFLPLLTVIDISAEIPLKERALYTTRFALEANVKEKSVSKIIYLGRTFKIHPGVFSPKIFPDTLFFADHIQVIPGECFLEVGAGSGLIAVAAALKGAGRVIAIDINPLAVANTIENGILNDVSDRLTVYEGDVFSPLGENWLHSFDTIWWNVPFMHIDREVVSDLEKALYDPGYCSLKKYLAEAAKWLKPNGRLLIGFSETHGHKEVLEQIAQEHGWSLELLAEQTVTLPIDDPKGINMLSIQLIQAKESSNSGHLCRNS